MRFPITESDIQSKRFSSIAKKLRKHWPLDPITLMQAQNILASMLGYRDFHDLRQCALRELPASFVSPQTRARVIESLMWESYRKQGIPLLSVHGLVSALPLRLLDFDAMTVESISESRYKSTDNGEPRRAFIFDEYSSYLPGANWLETTPQMIRAGAPAFRFSIQKDRKAFRWDRLESLVGKLPDDVVERLKREDRYRGLTSDEDLLVGFYRDEMLPLAVETAQEALHASLQLPSGFSYRFFGSRGLVLVNESLCGLIPIVFDLHSNGVFDAVLELMQGLPISTGLSGFVLGSDGMYHEEPGQLDAPLFTKWQIKTFDKNCLVDHQRGVGQTFMENGERYYRTNGWLDLKDVPGVLSGWFEGEKGMSCNSDSATPVWHVGFHRKAYSLIKANSKKAKHAILSAVKDGSFIDHIDGRALATEAHDKKSLVEISEYHPLSRDDELDEDLRQEYLNDHQAAVCHYTSVGKAILEAFPGLSGVGAITLGWLFYQTHNTYYESRDSWMVPEFDCESEKACVTFLSYLLLRLSADKVGASVRTHVSDGDCRSIYLSAELAYRSGYDEAELVLLFRSISAFVDGLDEQQRRLDRIDAWRLQSAAERLFVENSGYLFAAEAVSLTRPEPYLSKMFRESRKFSVTPITATQSLAEIGREIVSEIKNSVIPSFYESEIIPSYSDGK